MSTSRSMGTLIEAWASFKSFRPRDEDGPGDPPDDPGNPTVNFRGERRTNATHQSRTDPEAMLAKKGSGHEAHLSGNALMENRHKLLVDFSSIRLPAPRNGMRSARCWTEPQRAGFTPRPRERTKATTRGTA